MRLKSLNLDFIRRGMSWFWEILYISLLINVLKIALKRANVGYKPNNSIPEFNAPLFFTFVFISLLGIGFAPYCDESLHI